MPTSRGPATASELVVALHAAADPTELTTLRRRLGPHDEAVGIRMRDLFAVAKAATALPLDEVEALFASPLYEVRMAAVCVLDFRAKNRRVDDPERDELYRIYLGHHDRITTWDMVDRAAPSVVGGRLLGRDPAPLHDLAASPVPLRRRTAITAPLWFVRHGDADDLAVVLGLAAALADDPEPVVHSAVGIALKHSGGRDPRAVETFLDEHGGTLPRAVLREATAKLDPTVRRRLLERRSS